MTQLVQRRCLVTSAVLHGMLLGALALLSAFSPKAPPPPSQPYIILVPTADVLSTEPSRGGGPPGAETPRPESPRAAETPRVITPPPVPPPPVRQPPPVATPRTPPPAERPTPRNRVETSDNLVRNPQATPQDVDATRPTPKKSIEISSVKVPTPKEDRKKREQAAAAAAREEAARETQQREQDRNARLDWERRERERRESLSGVVKSLGSSLAPGTKIEIPGPGGGGAVVVNYADYVQTVFQSAWNRNRPATLAAKSAKSRVSLTIRRDGSFTYRVLAPSRIAEVDAAIGRILAQQRRLNPLPVELKSDDLEIIITFNLESSVPG